MKKFDIPKELSHLKISSAGYPIPYFASTKDGIPNFQVINVVKQKDAIEKKLCWVCGKKLYPKHFYFISGPKGYENQVSSDPAMHRVCAEFSLVVCPHLHIEKAKRRDVDLPPGAEMKNDMALMADKPPYILLVKADKFTVKELPKGGLIVEYRPIDMEVYHYIDGILEKSEDPK